MHKSKFSSNAIFPKGFSCAAKNCGIKEDGSYDLSVFYSSSPSEAAAVFTRNLVPGAPIIAGREIIRKGKLQAVVINSRVSNVGTGQAGIDNAYRMGKAAAEELNCAEDEVLMSSTGVIAVPLPIEKIEEGLKGMKEQLQTDPLEGARGIMTTDTYPKAISYTSPAGWTITIVGKGSGMIEPNMATMLVYIFTDADICSTQLDAQLRTAVADSFNMLSVDADTSTSDTVAILANGQAGAADPQEFQQALNLGCIRMTEILARDGEGASKLIRAIIRGARDEKQARIYAKAMINSPLIKTMAYGCDPNIGRMLMALGKCFDNELEIDRLILSVNGVTVFQDRCKSNFDELALRESIGGESVDFTVDLQLGDGEATAYGCDLTEGYIEENGAYYSS